MTPAHVITIFVASLMVAISADQKVWGGSASPVVVAMLTWLSFGALSLGFATVQILKARMRWHSPTALAFLLFYVVIGALLISLIWSPLVASFVGLALLFVDQLRRRGAPA